MPVYLVSQSSQKNTTPISFISNGVSSGSPCGLGGLGFGGLPHIREVAYDGYRTNIDAFVHATLNRVKTCVSLPAFGKLDKTEMLPIPCPRVSFPCRDDITLDQQKAIATKIGGGTYSEKIGKTTIFKVPFATIDMLPRLEKVQKSSFFSVPRDDVSLDGAHAFFILSNWLAGFLMTNQYPAFSDLLPTDVETPECLLSLPWDNCRDTYFVDIGEKKEDLRREKHKFRKISHEQFVAGGNQENGSADCYEKDEESLDAYLGDAVLTAKPSPFESGKNIGTRGSMPNLPGIAFPYFHGMILPDRGFLTRFVIDHAIRNLGVSLDDCKKEMTAIKNGLKELVNTSSGMALSHLCAGVYLALRTQSRLYMVHDVSYQGFCLLGGGYSVYDGASWHVPMSAADLFKDTALFDVHDAAVSEIVKILNVCGKKGGAMQEDVSAESFTGPVTLIGIIGDREIPKDKVDVLNRLVRKLRFGGGYNQVSVDSVVRMLQGLYIKEQDPDPSEPCFLSSINAPVLDRRYRWLATFGPEAPSFWNSKGVMHMFNRTSKRSAAEALGEEEEDEMQRSMPQKILISTKPIMTALEDLKSVERNKAISMDLKERASSNRCVTVAAAGERKRIWESLWDGSSNMGKEKGKARETAPSTAPIVITDFASFLDDL